MTFFIRARQLDIPTPTISTVASDDEDNFLTDPEKFFDDLPQPFRLINKVLGGLIEAAWEKISERERQREINAKRIKPPTYIASSKLEQYENITCLSISGAGVLFLGLGNSLAALQNDSYEEISSWKPDEEICVERISNVFVNSFDLHLLSVVDDMGFCHLMVYENEKFHSVCIVNELEEGAPKSNAVDVEFSKDGQSFGIILETNSVSTIEFYRVPLENWAKEIDVARKEYQKRVESVAATSADEEADPAELDVEFPSVKFSLSSQCLKVNGPPSVVGVSGKSTQQLLDMVGSGDVIGDGMNHLYSENALNVQDKLFHVLNERDLVYADEDKADVVHHPKFFFLKKSLMEPPIQGKTDLSYVYVGVWWSHHHNFYIYQLNKSGKNVEYKPDMVWPQCSDISSCSVTCDTALLAIGLSNGSMTLWDRNLSLVKNVLMISPGIPVVSINILIPQDSSQKEFSFHGKDIRLLVGSENGQICSVVCGRNPSSQVVVSGGGQLFDIIKPIGNLLKVFIVANKDGSIALRSTEIDEILCCLALPENLHYEDPYHNGCVIDEEGDILYLRVSSISSEESNILLFHLRNFPTLDKFRQCTEEVERYKSITFNDTVQSILKARMQVQGARTDKLASKWHNLDKQLEVIRNLKESMSNMRRANEFMSKSPSASRWGRSTSKVISHNIDLKRIK